MSHLRYWYIDRDHDFINSRCFERNIFDKVYIFNDFWWQFDRVGIYFANMHNIYAMIISVNCRPNYMVCSSVVEKILLSLLWFSFYYHCVMCKFCTNNFTVENLLFTKYLFIRKLCTNRYDYFRSPLGKLAFLSHLCMRIQEWIHKCNRYLRSARKWEILSIEFKHTI